MTRLDWVSDITHIGRGAWDDVTSSAGLFFRYEWIEGNQRALPCEPLFLKLSRDNRLVGVTPFLIVDASAYPFFVPSKLLVEVLGRASAPELATRIHETLPPSALVAAVPFGYASPLSCTPVEFLRSVAESARLKSEELGLSCAAFLYLGEADQRAIKVLEDAGYLSTPLETTWILDILPEWSDFEGFCRTQRHGKMMRYEHRTFQRRGFMVAWHDRLTDELLRTIAYLEHMHLLRHGHSDTLENLFRWYEDLRQLMPADLLVVTAADHRGVIKGFVLFLRSGADIIAKTVGIADDVARKDFLYFSISVYEPVRYAIKHGIRAIELGPAAAASKRARGAEATRLFGTFSFRGDSAVARYWPSVALALRSYVDRSDSR